MNKESDYIFNHYREGALDTKKALSRFKARTGYNERQNPLRWVAVAASILVLMIGGAMYYTRDITLEAGSGNTAKTYILDDGTKVVLSPNSSVTFSANNCRKIEISGMAYFEIVHNEEHPFLIKDEQYIINDIGTKLQVEEKSDETEVYVTEGAVYFAAKGNEKKGMTLRKGEGAILDKNKNVPHRKEYASGNSVSWATHELHFDNTPMSTVIEDLHTCFGKRFTCSETTKHLTGDFETTEQDEVVSIIEKTLGVDISIYEDQKGK